MITAGLNDDPRPMISRLNDLLTKALEKHWAPRADGLGFEDWSIYSHWRAEELRLLKSTAGVTPSHEHTSLSPLVNFISSYGEHIKAGERWSASSVPESFSINLSALCSAPFHQFSNIGFIFQTTGLSRSWSLLVFSVWLSYSAHVLPCNSRRSPEIILRGCVWEWVALGHSPEFSCQQKFRRVSLWVHVRIQQQIVLRIHSDHLRRCRRCQLGKTRFEFLVISADTRS